MITNRLIYYSFKYTSNTLLANIWGRIENDYEISHVHENK